MVKADLSRDYYGDLDLQPGADAADIKKQFKKLALTYHPDRNPGRENEVTAKFQLIQSAHEVLTDPTERAKYDANRVRVTYKTSGGVASGVRGNPWSSAGSQWAPPPKPPPTARTTPRNRPAAPSAGARRYDKFEAPKSSSQSAYEGADARRKEYEAWENMKPHHNAKTTQTRTAPKPPPRESPRPAKDFRKPAPVPPPRNGYDESTDQTPDTSPNRRSASTNASARRGFMPNTPGGDEPAAPRGAYFTTRAAPPEPPPRNPPANTVPNNVGVDPLQQFRVGEDGEKVPNLEKRYTPYATHGGEKLNPFESANLNNLNRSKTTREPTGKPTSNNVPRTGSDPNLNSPRRPRTKSHPVPVQLDSDSSDDTTDGPLNGHAFGKSRASTRRNNGVPPHRQQAPDASEASPKTHTPPLPTDQPNSNKTDTDKIFTFPVDDDTFKRTKPTTNGFTSNSAENISTTFNAEAWSGTFQAGGDFFKPNPKAPGPPSRGRAQSTSRSRGRSPVKVSTAPKFPPPAEPETMESPGGTKFSPEEWAQSFKDSTPGFFAPPPGFGGRQSSRKQRKPTMGGKAAVVDDSETPDEKPLFDAKPPGSATPHSTASPDAMDVDTPPVTNTVRQFTEKLNVNGENLKRPAGPSQSQSPTDTDTEALKVGFNDMKLADIISTLNLPVSPSAPAVPIIPAEFQRPNWIAFETFKNQFASYMKDWDHFNRQFMLHLVARQTQVEALGPRRWEDEDGAAFYRRGLKEDEVVLKHWQVAKKRHEEALKQYVIFRERLKTREETANANDTPSTGDRPRKKTH